MVATQRAIAMLDAEVSRQAMMMSFERLFLLYGLALTLALPLLLLMKKARGARGGTAH